MSKLALVTGGTRGIGASISLSLRDAGYLVAASYNGNASAASAFYNSTGINTFKWDVANYDECLAGVKKVNDAFGTEVDVLINNAGITRDAMFHKMSVSNWIEVINANLNSMFYMCNLVINGMRDRKFGRIVNISSVNGCKGQIGQANYSAAKAGVIGFTKALSQESASKNITVNAIAPGYISTNMTSKMPEDVLEKIVQQIPVGRMGTTEEIANTVLFLVDEKSSFITGSTIHINGGQYLT